MHPVVEAGVTQVNIDVPAGVWFDFFSDAKIEGDRVVSVDAPIEKLPLLVKAGSFIPMVAPFGHLKSYSSANLDIHFYYDPSVSTSHYRLLEDDGEAPDSVTTGQYQSIHFSSVATDDTVSKQRVLAIDTQVQGSYQGAPRSREVNYIIHNVSQLPSSIKINGKTIDELGILLEYNQATKQLSIPVNLTEGLGIVMSW